MRFRINKLAVVEIFLLQAILFRLLYFWFNTLDDALEQTKRNVGRLLVEKEVSCDQFGNVLTSLEAEASSAYRNTRADLLDQILICTSELAELRSFTWQANVFNIHKFITNRIKSVRDIMQDVFMIATRPRFIHRCTSLVCLDWVSVVDMGPVQYALTAAFPFTPRLHADIIIFASIGITFGMVLTVAILRLIMRYLVNNLHPWRISSLFMTFEVFWSPIGRICRMIVMSILYLAAFSVTFDSPDQTILIRLAGKLALTDPVDALVTCSVFWIASAIILLRLTWMHQRLTYSYRNKILDRVNRQVAQMWIDTNLEKIHRLNPNTIIDLLQLVELPKLTDYERGRVAAILTSNEYLMSIYSQRGMFSTNDPSELALFSRRIASILDKLGYREYPDLWSLVFCFSIICVPLVLW
jgi:hypothetical protein